MLWWLFPNKGTVQFVNKVSNYNICVWFIYLKLDNSWATLAPTFLTLTKYIVKYNYQYQTLRKIYQTTWALQTYVFCKVQYKYKALYYLGLNFNNFNQPKMTLWLKYLIGWERSWRIRPGFEPRPPESSEALYLAICHLQLIWSGLSLFLFCWSLRAKIFALKIIKWEKECDSQTSLMILLWSHNRKVLCGIKCNFLTC